MQRPAPALAVEAAPGRLAVDGDDLTGPSLLGESRDEAAETGLEGVGIEQPEDPREGVVARDAAFQVQKAAQQRLLGAPEQGHVDAAFGAAQRRRQRDQQDLHQIVALGIARARVDQILETRPKPLHAAVLPKSKAAAHQAHTESKRFYKFLMRFPCLFLADQSGKGRSAGVDIATYEASCVSKRPQRRDHCLESQTGHAAVTVARGSSVSALQQWVKA